MDLKLDLAKAVKIVIEKDENHLLEYILDKGEIKDVNVIEKEESSDKIYPVYEEPKATLNINDRYFIGKGEELASKIISARDTVSKVKEAISDTSNPDALHEILQDGTTATPKEENKEEDVKENKESFNLEQQRNNVMRKNLERSIKLMELVKNGSIDEIIKERNKKK